MYIFARKYTYLPENMLFAVVKWWYYGYVMLETTRTKLNFSPSSIIFFCWTFLIFYITMQSIEVFRSTYKVYNHYCTEHVHVHEQIPNCEMTNSLKSIKLPPHRCMFVDKDQLPYKLGRDFLIQCPELSLRAPKSQYMLRRRVKLISRCEIFLCLFRFGIILRSVYF